MRAELIRVEHAEPWYFTKYYYKCIDCGAEYFRHQYNERINPYCGKCQRKHDTEAQRQRNINHKNKLMIEELESLKIKMNTYCDDHGIYDWGLIDLIDERISELKGEKE